jgi:UDP-N-acetylmuramyl pentapeptide phosphotransferase/UDP-N-acetylglucosamine-1-phosphate transferase
MAWIGPLASAAVSAALTEAAIRYARRRVLLDQPGQRRSHRVPTPRGGGMGIVAVALLLLGFFAIAPTADMPRAQVLAALAGLVLVSLIGWWDDHRALPALPRLAVHALAALVLVGTLGVIFALAVGPFDAFGRIVVSAIGLILIGIVVWSINLHNFMDGINGLLACQTVFVFGALGAVLCVDRGASAPPSELFFCLAAATLGFLPFNFPHARVFMGDGGSGAIGYLMVAGVLLVSPLALPLWAILNSAFVVDATTTLVSRMANRRRWYSAHREHLYQWLVRSGFSHARVVGLYALWNLCFVLPCAILYVRAWVATPPEGLNPVVAPPLWPVPCVYVCGLAMWWQGKRWCLRRVRAGRNGEGSAHAPA